MTPTLHLLTGDARQQLATLPAESVDCVITSPPYLNLRDYNRPPGIWGGDPDCSHTWTTERYYWEGGASAGSHEAFTPAGPENAARLKATRWRETTSCETCGAWHGALGAEDTVEQYVQNLVEVFREVWRVLKPTGTCWLNLGDSYARNPKKGGSGTPTGRNGRGEAYPGGSLSASVVPWDRDPSGHAIREKSLIGVPWRVALALIDDGWILRSDVIWHKPNPCPESVRDRPTKSHEYVFLLTKEPRYFYDALAIKEPLARPEELTRATPARFGGAHKHAGYGTRLHSGREYTGNLTGRNKRTVWTVSTGAGFRGAHFATFPPALIRPMILAGRPASGTVLDPSA